MPVPHPVSAAFRRQAEACARLGAPLYDVLCRAMADDLDAGGPTAAVLAGHEAAPADDLLALRVLGGLHRLVLQGRAPALATHCRSVGGQARPDGAWEAVRPLLVEHADDLRAALDVPPQTNEPGRAAALVVGLLDAAHRTGARRVRLLEVGASAGLNLRLDGVRVEGDGPPPWAWGPVASPLVLAGAVHGPVQLLDVAVVERRGCDLAPVDVTTPEGRLRLTSFVWPDHVDRFERLRAALRLAQLPAQRAPVVVDAAPASAWLAERLAGPAPDDALDVVLHSVTRTYWPQEERDAVDAVLADAAGRRRLAVVGLELDDTGELLLDVDVRGPDGPDGLRTAVARAAPHGLPVRVLTGTAVPQARVS